MKFGLRQHSFVWPDSTPDETWERTKRLVQRAEADGFASYWLMDHFYNLPVHGSSEHEPFLDVWTTLPALAAVTERIRLGPLVSPVGYRNPALLARMAASLDVISNGRLYLGFGAGGYQPEYEMYGFEFPARPSLRIAQMEEAVNLIRAMWTQPYTTFHGQFFHVEEAVLEPKPFQQPMPPILIGGVGEKFLLPTLARVGDACNLFGPPAAFRRVRQVLRRYCEAEGRDEATIEKTTYDVVLCAPTQAELDTKKQHLNFQPAEWKTLIGTPAQLVDMVGLYAEEGAQHLLLEFHQNDEESYTLFVEEVMQNFGPEF
jgi:F420-dependent oxidoreductase-like protein